MGKSHDRWLCTQSRIFEKVCVHGKGLCADVGHLCTGRDTYREKRSSKLTEPHAQIVIEPEVYIAVESDSALHAIEEASQLKEVADRMHQPSLPQQI